MAWAATAGSLACYLAASMWLGPQAGAALTALYVLPCVIAGWGFGTSGGVLVALLSPPIHTWLISAGIMPVEQPPLLPILSTFAALVVGASVGVARDLRERLREKSGALAESEDRYRQLVDNSPEGVLVHERGVVVFANPSMARLTGAPNARALVGRTLVTLAPFEDRDVLSANFIFATPEARGPRSVEARLAGATGAPVDVVMTTMPIHYRGNRADLVLVREAALVRAPTRLMPALAR